jgi:hypothetical protein
MSVPCKFERSILSYDEHEVILRCHHPEIYEARLDDLKVLRQRLRHLRDKENTWRAQSGVKRAARGSREGIAFQAQPSIPCSASKYSPPP